MIKKAVKTVPELNGSPISFTKKTSKYPNNLSVDGSKSLKMNNNIDKMPEPQSNVLVPLWLKHKLYQKPESLQLNLISYLKLLLATIKE